MLTKTPIKQLAVTPIQVSYLVIISGLINGFGTYFFFKFLAEGGNFTQGLPLILVFVVLITAIFGILIFGDTFNLKTLLGFICGALAIYLLS